MKYEDAIKLWAPEVVMGDKRVSFGLANVERSTDGKKGVGLHLVQLREPESFDDVVRVHANLVFMTRESLITFQKVLEAVHQRFDELEAKAVKAEQNEKPQEGESNAVS